ncbi:MAG: S8 family serine peptidase [Anaeromyxobacter sp.]
MLQAFVRGSRSVAAAVVALALFTACGAQPEKQEQRQGGGVAPVVDLGKLPPKPEVIPGQLIVKLRPGAGSASALLAPGAKASELSSLMSRLGATAQPFRVPASSGAALRAAEAVGLDRVLVVRSSTVDVSVMARLFARDAAVEYAEPAYRYKADFTGNDPYLNSSGAWGQAFGDLWGFHDVGGDRALDFSSGNGVLVAVVDTGLDLAHEDIQGRAWTNPGEIPGNGVDDDHDGYVDDVHGWNFVANNGDPTDDMGHGSHVAGTIAANANNHLGIVGVAPSATILPVKALDTNGGGDTLTLASAMIYAGDRGAKVINNSWGGSASRLLDDVVASLHDRGIVVVNSAGNYGFDATVFSPARAAGGLCVAAVDAAAQRASFSNYGDRVDVGAPGVDVLSLAAAQGHFQGWYPEKVVGGSYVRLDGTSMAAPHVSGVAALLLSARPGLTPEQVRWVLRHTASPLPGQDAGAGAVRADEALLYVLSGQSIPDTTALLTGPARFSATSAGAAIPVTGTATGSSFASYELAWAQDHGTGTLVFTPFETGTARVVNGLLGSLDPAQLSGADPVVVRLRVRDLNGQGNEFQSRFLVDPAMKPGWPRNIEDMYTTFAARSPVLVDLAGDGKRAVVVTGEASIHAYRGDGSAVAGFPLALPYPALTPVTVADLDADGKPELVLSLVVPPGQAPIYAYRADGTLVPGFPAGRLPTVPAGTLYVQATEPAIAADLDGDGKPEIAQTLIAVTSTVAQLELTVVDAQGRTRAGWPQQVSPTIPDVKSNGVADVDGDGQPELVVASRPGTTETSWGYDTFTIFEADGTRVRDISPPEGVSDFGQVHLIDADHDGKAEIFSVGYTPGGWTAFMLRADGTELPGWPIVLPPRNHEPAVFTDLDGDGVTDVAIADLTGLYGFHLDGTAVAGYPFEAFFGLGQWTHHDLTVAPVAAAPAGAFFYAGGAHVFALDYQGRLLPGWPHRMGMFGSMGAAALGDIDGNGKLDVFAVGAGGQLYDWEEALAGGVEGRSDWPEVGGPGGGQTRAVPFRHGLARLYFRGTANAWGSTAMKLVGDYLWSVDVTQGPDADPRFKFDLNGDWSVNYGDQDLDGVADQNGADIRLLQSRYRITFDELTRRYTVTDLGAQWTRTVVLVKAVTSVGQNLSLRGGIDEAYARTALGRTCTAANQLCAIPIRHRNLLNATTQPLKVGDTLLDWYGPQAGQSSSAQGSPADWTTNVWQSSWGTLRTVAVDGYGVTPVNTFGAHYWMLDVDMDCSKTVNGWFEVKSFLSGGAGFEAAVSQPGAPWSSGNHFARCGQLNVFERGVATPIAIRVL